MHGVILSVVLLAINGQFNFNETKYPSHFENTLNIANEIKKSANISIVQQLGYQSVFSNLNYDFQRQTGY